MTLLQPIAGLRPAPNHVEDVIAPPYDVVSTEEARTLAEGRPWSFLHISKPEIDLPPGTNAYSPEVYATGRKNFQTMRTRGVLIRDAAPSFYIYRQTQGDHVQTGLVAGASVGAYESNVIRKHEHTQPKKEDDRVRQIDALGAQTGPVMLVHRKNDGVTEAISRFTGAIPDVDVTFDGVRHELWAVGDPESVALLSSRLADVETLYIADGHHRSAAARRVAGERRAQGGGDGGWNSFLSVTFPEDDLRILAYNRVVRDLGGLSPEAFLSAAAERFRVTKAETPVDPGGNGRFGMFLQGAWYALDLKLAPPAGDPVASLDVSLLAEHLLEPTLGIHDQRTDPRIDFVGGSRGLSELERRVDSDEMAVAFSFYPTSVAELLAVADAGAIMPTKSTWFDPKLADGLVSHVIDEA